MSSRILHPVYVALDNRQYSRAIKLCQGLDPSIILGRALMAHAYAKSGQRFKALLTLQALFGSTQCFPELQLTIRYECSPSAQANHAKKPVSAEAKKTKKPVKKGKKKGGSNSTSNSNGIPSTDESLAELPSLEEWDLVDRLDNPPSLPDDWETRLPNIPMEPDETLLDTLAMVLSTQLRLPLTTYQLFYWASLQTTIGLDLYLARKLIEYGLQLLLYPQFDGIIHTVLTHLQSRALQISKLQLQQQQSVPTTSDSSALLPSNLWAAQIALWRLRFSPQQCLSDQDRSMLPRLAASLAHKSFQHFTSTNDPLQEQLVTRQSFLLYLRALEVQGGEQQWAEMLSALRTLDQSAEWVLLEKLRVLQNSTESDGDSIIPVTDELLQLSENLVRHYPDDWQNWQSYWAACRRHTGGDAAASARMVEILIEDFVEENNNTENAKKPPRAPRLMRLELASSPGSQSEYTLVEAFQEYGNLMASRNLSAFSDVSVYLEKVNSDEAKSLLSWSGKLLETSKQELTNTENGVDAGSRKCALKRYIFGTQVHLKIISVFPGVFDDWLLSWREVIGVWNSYRLFEAESGFQQVSVA